MIRIGFVASAFCTTSLLLAGTAGAFQDSIPAVKINPAPGAAQKAPADTAATLVIGDKAPALDVQHWIKGDNIADLGDGKPLNFEEGNVYVVEFWATWCGPCVRGMPHLSELQKKYKDYDVHIIGVTREELGKPVNFLAKTNADGLLNNDRMNYTVACDPDKSVNDDYMKAAQRNTIPTAFLVGKDGRIEWIGHPASMDDALEAVVTDSWNRAEFKTSYEEALRSERFTRQVRERMSAARKAGEWEQVLGILDEATEQFPNDMSWKMQRFTVLLENLDRGDEAYTAAKELAPLIWDDANALNSIAWTGLTLGTPDDRDLDCCLRFAKRANELTDNSAPAILDTLARAYWKKGERAEAIAIQERAVVHAAGTSFNEGITATLDAYRKEAMGDH